MRIIFFLALFSSAFLIQAQDKIIKGRIANADGQPHAGIMVQAYNIKEKVYTDKDGNFTLTGQKDTKYLAIADPFNQGEIFYFNITKFKNKFVTVIINSQTRGNVFGLSKEVPLKNINVEVVGQNKTTKTSKHGYFNFQNLDRSKGITLKLSDPNKIWKSQEISLPKIAKNNEYTPIILEQYISPLLANNSDTLGVAYLNDNTTQLTNSSNLSSILNIQSISQSKGGYTIKERNSGSSSNLQIDYMSSVSLSQVGRQPKLQSTYAQGQNDAGEFVWQGADKNQQFSWGPEISSLEYSNAPYSYDKNGALLSKGSGNGNTAKTYDPTDFFRTGISFNNALTLKKMYKSRSILSVSLGQDRVNSPIPNSHQANYNGSIRLEKVRKGAFENDFGITGNLSNDRLMNNGASHARLLQSVYTTPPTFDNANGMSRKEALHTNNSWRLTNGTNRSYAPNDILNPFGLLENIPDKDKSSKVLLYAKTKYTKNKLESNASLSFNKQWDNRTVGIASMPPIQNLKRKENFSNLNFSANAVYRLSRYTDQGFKVNGGYSFNSLDNTVTRLETKVIDKARYQHDIYYGTTYEKKNLFFELNNKHYFSNTAHNYVNLFPSFGAKYKVDRLFYDELDWEFVEFMRLFGSTSRSLGEAPLVYRNMAALSTTMNSTTALKTYYETEEITSITNKMKPEMYFNKEIGVEFAMWRNRFNIEFNYFHNSTYGTIAPAPIANSNFKLTNIGNHTNYGYIFSAKYNSYRSQDLSYYIFFNINHTRNMVTSVSDDKQFVQLAGFSNVGTFFTKDEPLGVIYGNTYKRDTSGKVIIGADGFPLVDNSLKKIGDPTPDFVMNLSPILSWKGFEFAFNLCFSKGGDVWNGTRAYLDFQGMSESSGNERNIKEHIFEGITESGTMNNKVVSFYDPALPLNQNRWVRYGAEGVAEDYIEDATFLRLTNLSLHYKLPISQRTHLFEKMRIGLHAQNLFQVTAYKGVDPTSKLFNYSTGNGLDLFNSPSLRKYSLSINFNF